MITRPLLWDSLREIRRHPARFFSILAIVAIGAGMFAGMKAVAPAMKYTADQYYDRQNMMDIRVLSTLGLDEADIEAIEAVEGVETVQPGYSVDVITIRDAAEFVLRVHSLPSSAQDGDEYLNMPRLVEGRLPSGPGEAVVELNRNVDFPIALGDTITVSSGRVEDITGTLAHSEYTVVGRIVSPYYLTYQREPSDIGSGRVHLFMMVEGSEFLLPTYTEALVTVAGTERLSSYSPEYRDAVEVVTSRLEDLGEERAEIRLAELEAAAAAAAQAGLGNEVPPVIAPTWFVLDRDKLYSYADYAVAADRMDGMAALFPVFLFAVAALVCLTTMARMVDEQRTAIGTYKALGYRRSAIAFKYVLYAATASLLGGIVGVIVGLAVFPELLFNAWKMLYELPPMEREQHVDLPAATVLVSVVLITATAWFSVRRELSTVPAALMRPKAPRAGRVILLERIPVLWKRLSFSQKVTMRNLFRYKKRFLMTVLGVMGCAALLIASLGLSDSITNMVTTQYGEIRLMDLEVRMEPAAAVVDREAVLADLRSDDDVESVLPIAQVNATVQFDDGEVSAPLITPLAPELLSEHIALRSAVDQGPIALPQSGAVITQQMAEQLGVAKGDSIAVDRGTGEFTDVTVAAIAENYIFHYVYMSPEAYEEAFGQPPELSGAMVKLGTEDRDVETSLGSRLIDLPEVASVTYSSDALEQSAETVQTLDNVTLSMIISAGLLAFVVLYNLTIINLSERTREVATIKVLGFRDREVAMYIYRENFLLTVLGGLIGLLAGIGLHRLMIRGIENEDMMFGNYISGLSFVEAFGITLFFAIAVSVFTYRKLIGVDMVESLKSIE